MTSGSYDSGFLDLTMSSFYNPAFVTANGGIAGAEAALLAGIACTFNIHTSTFTGGEIRGFLVEAVPEPATWAMALTGLGVLVLRRMSK